MNYKDPDTFWAEWDLQWAEQQEKTYSKIRELKSYVDSLRLSGDEKKKIKGMINDIGRRYVDYGKEAGELHLRELEYVHHIGEVNDEIKVLRRIAVEMMNKK